MQFSTAAKALGLLILSTPVTFAAPISPGVNSVVTQPHQAPVVPPLPPRDASEKQLPETSEPDGETAQSSSTANGASTQGFVPISRPLTQPIVPVLPPGIGTLASETEDERAPERRAGVNPGIISHPSPPQAPVVPVLPPGIATAASETEGEKAQALQRRSADISGIIPMITQPQQPLVTPALPPGVGLPAGGETA